ncbi:MAG: hypothetical protein WCP04_12715 [Pseudomonadota bacterium]
MRLHAFWLGLVWVLASALGACHGGDAPGTPPAARSATSGVSPAPAAVGLTAAVPVSAGTLAVDLQFGIAQAPRAGVPFPIRVVVSSAIAQPPLLVRFYGEEGLEVLGDAERRTAKLDPGSPATLELSLRGLKTGIHLVSVVVAQDPTVGAASRSFQFPVLVTNP